MLGLEYTEVGNMLRFTGFRVNCILKIQGILNVFSSEYSKVLKVLEVQKCYICKKC